MNQQLKDKRLIKRIEEFNCFYKNYFYCNLIQKDVRYRTGILVF